MGADSYSEISLVEESRVQKHWKRLDTEGIEVHGVGKARMGERVLIPARFRTHGDQLQIEARVCNKKSLPPGIDLLICTKLQHKLKMKIDQGNDRLEIRNLPPRNGLVIDLEPTYKIRRRMTSRGIKVLDLASGS